MPRTPQVGTCVFCPHLSNLTRSVSCVLDAAHCFLVSVCCAPFSLVSQCAGTPSDAGTTSKLGYNGANESANHSNQKPRRVKPPNSVATVALFLNLLASVLTIVVSVLKLLEMTNQR